MTTTSTEAPAKTYLQTGDTVFAELPYSEVCCHMRVAGQVMQVELVDAGRGYKMAQLWNRGHHFSFPITTGEAGIYTEYAQDGQDGQHRYYIYAISS